MTTAYRPRLAAAATLALILAGPAPMAAAQEVVVDTNGDWEVVCSEADRNVCAIRQIGKGSDGNDVLAVTIRSLDGVTAENGQRVPAAIDIVTPLGVALRAGVRVTIDSGEPRAAPYEVCVPSGCLVRSPMSDEFVSAMKRGSTATVTVVSTQQGEVKVPISLRGFTASYDALDR